MPPSSSSCSSMPFSLSVPPTGVSRATSWISGMPPCGCSHSSLSSSMSSIGSTRPIRGSQPVPEGAPVVPVSESLSSLRWNQDKCLVEVIDQTLLPHTLHWIELADLDDYCHAIRAMQVRGAPLIGITAAFGLANALARDPSTENLHAASRSLLATRPTAVNLRWALDAVIAYVHELDPAGRADAALARAQALRASDIANCSRIGEHGLQLLRALRSAG